MIRRWLLGVRTKAELRKLFQRGVARDQRAAFRLAITQALALESGASDAAAQFVESISLLATTPLSQAAARDIDNAISQMMLAMSCGYLSRDNATRVARLYGYARGATHQDACAFATFTAERWLADDSLSRDGNYVKGQDLRAALWAKLSTMGIVKVDSGLRRRRRPRADFIHVVSSERSAA
jgi:hypothetical protein